METNLRLGREVQGFSVTLCNCSNCPDAIKAIGAMKQIVRFLDPRPKDPDRTLASPESTRLGADGSIEVGLDITHPFLALDSSSLGLNWAIAVATFMYDARNSSVIIDQTNSPQGTTAEEIVQGLVKLAEYMAPVLGPTYGTVDVFSAKLAPRRVRTFADVRYWCYANVFSAELAKKSPKDFFAGMPSIQQKTLPDRSLLLKHNDTFANWYLSPPKSVEKYLATHAAKIQLFRQSTKRKSGIVDD